MVKKEVPKKMKIPVMVALDEETYKIWKKLPNQKKSETVREFLRKLDPTTGEKKPQTPTDMIKKLLTTEPSEAKSTKAQRSGRHTKMFSEMGITIGKALTTYSKPCPTQTSAWICFA